MVRLREIMTCDIVTMTPETTVREAMELLATNHVSGAPVVSGGTLVGVVSASDLMAFAGALPGVPTERDTNAEWVETGEPPVDVEDETDNEAPGAFFSDLWEDAGADVAMRFENVSSPEWNFLEEHDVSEVMTRIPLATLAPDESAEAAAELMRENHIHRVLVVENDRVIGIVSSFDIARAVADHRFGTREYVFNRDQLFADDGAD